MTKIVQLHRMSTASAGLYIGPQGEVIVENGPFRLRVQDGATPGGFASLVSNLNLADLADPVLSRMNLGAAPVANPAFTGSAGLTNNQNALTAFFLTNNDPGVLARGYFGTTNGSQITSVGNFGTGYTPLNPTERANGGYLISTSTLDVYTNGVGSLRFGTNNIPRMAVQANGQVTIGQAAPFGTEMLGVHGNIVCDGTVSTANTRLLQGASASLLTHNQNYLLDTVAFLSGYMSFLEWNSGLGFALLFIAGSGTIITIASSNSFGGNSCFDTVNNQSSNGGNGIALVTSGGNVFAQTKDNYTGPAPFRLAQFG